MVTNWTLEVIRWKVSITPIEKISLKSAITDVFGGLLMNWILPFTSGDFLTRIIAKQNKYMTASAIILNRIIMFCCTLLIGAIGVSQMAQYGYDYLLIILVVGLIISIGMAIRRKIPQQFLAYFTQLQSQHIRQILMLSIARYFVFTVQFILLIKLFNPSLEYWTIFAGIGWIFLIRSAIPSLFGGIGLREASAFMFFSVMVADISLVIVPVFLLWLLNTLLPSLFGLVMIWKLKPQYLSDSTHIAS